ncbi:MAG: cupin domain-containing protein [Halobacteriales archaeon]|nr:cupin domain-containing protein [Halobacteriales archaeon]
MATTQSTETSSEPVTFGRTLVDGDPVDDGLTFPADSPTLAALADATSPLISNPVRGEYGAALVTAEESDGERSRALAITPPGAQGPPEHYHPGFAETFEVVEGEFVFEVEGEPSTLAAGESVTIEPGTPHTFRNESASYATCVVESRPAGRLEEVVQLLFGLAHEGKLPDSGRPSFFQAMVMADEMDDDTVFTSPPPAVQSAMATVFAPLGRLLGYRDTYPEFAEDTFWEARVEQPPSG